MATTPKLKFTYVEAAQSQKHVPVNENSVALDALIQCSILGLYTVTPPVSPSDGDRYIIGASATGAWAGKDYKLAYLVDGVWRFFDPQKGWIVFNEADNRLYMLNSSFAWKAIAYDDSFTAKFDKLGLGGATPDASNRLSINSPQALFNNAGAGVNLYLNKSSAVNDAAFTFQTAFSTRAIFGLLANNNFTLKVSPDGSSFYSPLVINSDGTTITFTGQNPNNNNAVAFSKSRSNTTSYRYSYGDVGGFTSDAAGGAYWRGVHMFGPTGGINYSGALTYPSMANYFEYDAAINPTYSRFVWDVGNSGGNTHELIFRVNSSTDLLKLNGSAASFAKSIIPFVDNSITLGASGARWSAVWAANGTIQTSDARDKNIVSVIDAEKAVNLLAALSPVLFNWKVGGYDVVDIYDTSVVNPNDASSNAVANVGKRVITAKPGLRTHAGFIAQDVKSALDVSGLDFGVWGIEDIKNPDSKQFIRPDQLIPILWTVCRYLLAKQRS